MARFGERALRGRTTRAPWPTGWFGACPIRRLEKLKNRCVACKTCAVSRPLPVREVDRAGSRNGVAARWIEGDDRTAIESLPLNRPSEISCKDRQCLT